MTASPLLRLASRGLRPATFRSSFISSTFRCRAIPMLRICSRFLGSLLPFRSESSCEREKGIFFSISLRFLFFGTGRIETPSETRLGCLKGRHNGCEIAVDKSGNCGTPQTVAGSCHLISSSKNRQGFALIDSSSEKRLREK